MDVARSPLQCREDGGIDEANDWTHVALSCQTVDGDRLVAGFIFTDYIQREDLAGFFQYPFRLFGLLENFANLRQRGDLGDDALA